MSVSFFIYIAEVFDKVNQLLFILFIIWGIVLIITLAIDLASYDIEERPNLFYSFFKKSIYMVCIGLVLLVVTPSKTTVYLMAGAELATHPKVTEIGDKTLQLINKKLDEALK